MSTTLHPYEQHKKIRDAQDKVFALAKDFSNAGMYDVAGILSNAVDELAGKGKELDAVINNWRASREF